MLRHEQELGGGAAGAAPRAWSRCEMPEGRVLRVPHRRTGCGTPPEDGGALRHRRKVDAVGQRGGDEAAGCGGVGGSARGSQ